jgi:hypothetical protein
MAQKNPLQCEAGSSIHRADDGGILTRKTLTLQGNAAMRLRLSALIWVHGLRDTSRKIAMGGFDL